MSNSFETDIHERIAEFVREAETAADRGREALGYLDDGDAQKACSTIASAHMLNGYFDGIMGAFASEGIQP